MFHTLAFGLEHSLAVEAVHRAVIRLVRAAQIGGHDVGIVEIGQAGVGISGTGIENRLSVGYSSQIEGNLFSLEQARRTVFERIIKFVSEHPGKTGGEIAKGLFGPDAEQPRVNPDLHTGLDTGRLRREGLGGGADPYRYYLKGAQEEKRKTEGEPQENPGGNDFDCKLAVLEEGLQTMQAQHESALDQIRADMARQGEETARRELRITRTVLGAVGLAVVILGLLIRLP